MIAKSQPESERMMAIRQLLIKSVRFGHSSTGHAIQARSLLPKALCTTSLPQAQVARTDVDGLPPTYVTSLATARQYDVANAQRLFDPEGVASRLPGMRTKRLENYITAGPDYL